MLTFTAFAPALGIYGIVLLMDSEYASGSMSILGAVALWAICHLSLRHSMKHAPRIELRPTSVEVADNETIGFLLVYLLPLITRNMADYNWLAFGAHNHFRTEAPNQQTALALVSRYEVCAACARGRACNVLHMAVRQQANSTKSAWFDVALAANCAKPNVLGANCKR